MEWRDQVCSAEVRLVKMWTTSLCFASGWNAVGFQPSGIAGGKGCSRQESECANDGSSRMSRRGRMVGHQCCFIAVTDDYEEESARSSARGLLHSFPHPVRVARSGLRSWTRL